jgi:hypothetical protein
MEALPLEKQHGFVQNLRTRDFLNRHVAKVKDWSIFTKRLFDKKD